MKRKAAVTPEERALFLDAVGDATPLDRRDRLPVRPPPPSPARVEVLPPEHKLAVSGDGQRYQARAPGVSHVQISDLRKAHTDASVDLHGMTVEVGRAELQKFLLESRRLGRRIVLIVHGKGLHSDAGAPLREAVLAALLGPMSGFVHALASSTDGGATIVMMRGAK